MDNETVSDAVHAAMCRRKLKFRVEDLHTRKLYDTEVEVGGSFFPMLDEESALPALMDELHRFRRWHQLSSAVNPVCATAIWEITEDGVTVVGGFFPVLLRSSLEENTVSRYAETVEEEIDDYIRVVSSRYHEKG